jgi:hypothetical protein
MRQDATVDDSCAGLAPGALMMKQLFDKLGFEVTLKRFAPD